MAATTKKRKKSKGGRPTVFTPELVTILEMAFAIDASVEEACSAADISRNAFYEYLKRNPSFNDRIANLRQRPVLKARQTVVNALDRNPELALKYLERKRKDEFALKQQVEHSGGIETILSPEHQADIAARIAAWGVKKEQPNAQ